MQTIDLFEKFAKEREKVFSEKQAKYGNSLRYMRNISIASIIKTKAFRCQTIQLNGTKNVNESVAETFEDVFNYAIIGLCRCKSFEVKTLDFESEIDKLKALLVQKNNDYGDFWRELAVEYFTDVILTKSDRICGILRAQSFNENDLIQEFQDIANYAFFAVQIELETF